MPLDMYRWFWKRHSRTYEDRSIVIRQFPSVESISLLRIRVSVVYIRVGSDVVNSRATPYTRNVGSRKSNDLHRREKDKRTDLPRASTNLYDATEVNIHESSQE